eukprot:3718415-Alexandrium_andersonii.AAC.1
MQNGFTRSELELRGPISDLNIGPRSSRGVHSAPLCALGPMATTRRTPGGGELPDNTPSTRVDIADR